MSGYYNRNNRGITKKLGPVTAYADAVLAGYKGTREQWAQDMAKLGQNVTQVAQNTKLTTELATQTEVNTEQVAKNTADVRRLAEETSDNAVQVASNTAESNRLAEETKQAAAQAKEDAEYAGAAADNFRVDTTLSEAGKAAEAKTTGEKFARLSEEIDDVTYKSQNIIYPYLDDFKCYGNMLGVCSIDIKEGYYATSAVGQEVKYFTNPSYTAHLLKVKQTKYNFKNIRFISVLDKNGLSLYYTPDANSVDMSLYPSAKYLVVCSLTNGSGVFEGYIGDVDQQKYCYPVKSKPMNCEFLKLDGGTDYRGYFGRLVTSRNKSVLTLSFNFTAFDNLTIAFVNSDSFATPLMEIDVSNTGLRIIAPDTGTTNVEHGMMIQNNLQIVIPMGFESNYLRVVSNGVEFGRVWYPRVTSLCYPAVSLTAEYTNLRASFASPDFNAKYWLFGDSYFTNRNDRWVYYLRRDERDKDCMIDGFPGENSAKALKSFKTSLYYGTPEKAVWCLGMNNPDDGAINAEWLECVTEFIKICELNDIAPILATIPNTPIIDNSYKNEWVKNSGVRYVDFASAVQSNENEWFDGMLSADNVHPTETGAITLYYKFLTDFPEVYQ